MTVSEWIAYFQQLAHDVGSSIPTWIDKTLVELIVLFLLVAWLKRERKKLQRTIEYHVSTVKQLVLANRDAVEVIEQVNHPAGIEHWEQLREIWSEARDRIEEAVNNLDGRVRRKYGNIARYSYAPIIRQLRDDRAISARAADALLSMNEQFLALRRRPAAATAAIVNQFENWRNIGTGELPSLS